MTPYTLWIILCAWFVASGWILSAFKGLNQTGYLIACGILFMLLILLHCLKKEHSHRSPCIYFKKLVWRFSKPIPLIYLIYLFIAFLGGVLYPPTNYDALCYRIPKILHWWHEGQWHWIGGWNARMDFSSAGFEWLMFPQFVLLKTDRLFFLINLISYALLPGLIYSAFTRLGISKRVAWYWMWIIPSAYCFVLQAGSIGNDCFAAVYLLSAVVFALRSLRRSSWSDAALSLLSAALLTGAKASNLPLLLPLLFLIAPLWKKFFCRPFASIGILMIAAVVSFLPVAISNTIHTGDWSGDPHNCERFKLSNPVAGLIGNTLQLSLGCMEPPVFPVAKLWSAKAEDLLSKEPLASLRKEFPRMSFGLRELSDEEGAGIGLGVAVLLLVSLGAGLITRMSGVISMKALTFGGLSWIALLVLMGKFGNDGISRLIACYYPVIVIPVLAMRSQVLLVRTSWWKGIAVLCQLAVLPSIILSPPRPMLPINSIIDLAEHAHLVPALTERIRLVYLVYANRNDQLAIVREHLPPGVKTIGFAGTSDESEYSFWKPYGNRIVRDLNSVDGKMPDLHGVDCIVGSEWGISDRYHLNAKELSHLLGGEILWEGKVAAFAGRDAVTWYVIDSPANK